MTATLSRDITADIATVTVLLLSPRTIPDWNPAFKSITGPDSAIVGHAYDLVAIRGLTGRFYYDAVTESQIDMRWTVAGMLERCTWQLTPLAGSRTQVSHTVSRSGPLATLLRHTLDDLPALRLERLAQRASAEPRAS